MARERLEKLIAKIARSPKSRIILMGDLINVATRTSKSSPHEQTIDADGQMAYCRKLLLPVADKILGSVNGNHERRLQDIAGLSPSFHILTGLGREDAYCGDSAYVAVCVSMAGIGECTYRVYAHHTLGGGATLGGPINRVYKLREISDADIYLGGHSHELMFAQRPILRGKDYRTQTYVICGSYLSWENSYAEALMLAPRRIGSPVIRLQANEWRVGVQV